MGTRHIIAVMVGGQYHVAQYGQWDGYPTGQGVEVLGFLRDADARAALQRNAPTVTDLTMEKIKEIEAFGGEWTTKWPYLSRDHGSNILKTVSTTPDLMLKREIKLAAESYIEWVYVIDFDKNTLEVFDSNDTPLAEGDRFFDLQPPLHDAAVRLSEPGHVRYPARLRKSYDLAALPTNEAFLADFASAEEE